MKEKDVKTTYRIKEKYHKALKILAVKQGVYDRVLIEEFIKDGLKKYGVKLDEQIIKNSND